MAETVGEQETGLWNPLRQLQKVSEVEVRLSRGFLRCRPEKWFPGFGAHWLPLAHSLGVDVRFIEARPILGSPPEQAHAFICSIDDEPFGFFFDEASYQTIVDAVSPGAQPSARSVAGEYLARRLMSSLVDTWSGPESSVVRYESEHDPATVRSAASIRISVTVNNNQCTIWLGLGKLLVERLDGLWRRQLRAQVKPREMQQQVRLEVAELAVPPPALVDYLRSGALIDLEIPAGDVVTLRLAEKPWQLARLRNLNGTFVCEMLPGSPPAPAVPEGTTRLAIELGTFSLDRGGVLELSQPGAMFDTGQAVTERASLVINSEKVGEGSLGLYEGRFALTVA